MTKQDIAAIAKAMMAPGKGLLAMDESNRTCNKRFADVGIAQTEENRRAYRELIVTTPSLGTAISGAILYEEWRLTPKSRRKRCFIEQSVTVPRDRASIPMRWKKLNPRSRAQRVDIQT
jgi:fructose-bisphosphate aldolase class 1